MRLAGIALALILAGASEAPAAQEVRFTADEDEVAYCAGFWRGLVTMIDYGLQPTSLRRSLDEEAARAGNMLAPFLKPDRGDRAVRVKLLGYVQSGNDDVQVALRDAKRTLGMGMQETAIKIVAYQAPLCDNALARLEQVND